MNNQFVKAKENKMARACSKREGGKLRARYWWRNLKEIHSLGDNRRSSWVDGITMDLKQDGLAWSGFIWLKTVSWRTLVKAVKSSRFP